MAKPFQGIGLWEDVARVTRRSPGTMEYGTCGESVLAFVVFTQLA
jgi:hypothetical protein